MKRWRFLVTFLIFVKGATALAGPQLMGYRVVRASPQEFASALRQPLPKGRAPQPTDSRLARFFRIKNKTVEGKTIRLEVFPDVPLLQDYFPSSQILKVQLVEDLEPHPSNELLYTVFIELKGSRFLQSKLQVEPHSQGSLLRLSTMRTNMGEWTLKAFEQAALRLGFLFPTREAATADASPGSSKSK